MNALNALTIPNKTLFLSYSRKQTDWTDSLYTAIDTYTHYQRWRDNKIPESADWWASICLHIEGCYAFVAVLSPDYLNSVYCMGELNYALKLHKPIIALNVLPSDYPLALNEQRIQFARVQGLEMSAVINKVLSACNEITLGYVQDLYSLDIHARPHLRPSVPTPPKNQPAPEEDKVLNEQLNAVTVHGEIPTSTLIDRYFEEKTTNLRLARDLLAKISARSDKHSWFDLEEENTEVSILEKATAHAEAERQHIKQVREAYEGLERNIKRMDVIKALKAIDTFKKNHPNMGDTKRLIYGVVLPAPFDWCPIPAGKVTIESGGYLKESTTFDIPAFEMAKYPVTNVQYAKFIEAKGYEDKQWWTDEGWTQRAEEQWTEPHYWQNTELNGANQPVVGVSWYEAVAFCTWLSSITGDTIMLPTEQEWQRAAQAKPDGGDTAWTYVWGNDWDGKKCNNSVRPEYSRQSTVVTHYETLGNVSPCGVVDLVGNVWEWCLTDYTTGQTGLNGTNVRCWCSASWFDSNSNDFRAASREFNVPSIRSGNLGMRLSRS